MPQFSPWELTGRTRGHIVEVDEPRCSLHRDVVGAFRALVAEAAEAGIALAAISGFRDFEQQLSIWNGKFRGQRPVLDRDGRPIDVSLLSPEAAVRALLTWSALPGASRHHWGTDVDVIDRNALAAGQRTQLVPAEYAAGGVFEQLGRWLDEHCEDFGFYRPYDVDRGGVQPEPWHLSYAPISSRALAQMNLEVLAEALADVDIAGGAAVIEQLPDIYRRYVLAVAAPPARALAASAGAPDASRAARPS